MSKYSVSIEKLVNDQSLKVIYTPKDIADLYITSQDVNRPGLMLAGFEDYFDPKRIQFLGLTETEYIRSLGDSEAKESMERFLSKRPAAVILTRDLDCDEVFLNLAKKYEVPILATDLELYVINDFISRC